MNSADTGVEYPPTSYTNDLCSLAANIAVANAFLENQLTTSDYSSPPPSDTSDDYMEPVISSYLSSVDYLSSVFTSPPPTSSEYSSEPSTATNGDYMELAIASYLSSADYLNSPSISPSPTPSDYSSAISTDATAACLSSPAISSSSTSSDYLSLSLFTSSATAGEHRKSADYFRDVNNTIRTALDSLSTSPPAVTQDTELDDMDSKRQLSTLVSALATLVSTI